MRFQGVQARSQSPLSLGNALGLVYEPGRVRCIKQLRAIEAH